jgi:hypothetical protein
MEDLRSDDMDHEEVMDKAGQGRAGQGKECFGLDPNTDDVQSSHVERRDH